MTGPNTMMALRAHHRGGPEELVYEIAPRPRPGTGEILVAVGAASITFAELSWDETWQADGEDRTPIIPSHEFAGVITEVGDTVDGLSVGDSVFGLVPFDRDGAAADFIAVPAEDVARKNPEVPDEIAAAAVLPALTAWEALLDHAQVVEGQRVLIRGGAGGVGAFLTQFAHRLGAHVTATISKPADEAWVRGLGADEVIVGATEAAPRTFDVAIDAVGADIPEWLFACVVERGRLITLQEPPSQELAETYGIEATFFVVATRRERLDELATLLDSGEVQVAIAQTFPLSEGRAAFESGRLPRPRPGKTVLVVAEH